MTTLHTRLPDNTAVDRVIDAIRDGIGSGHLLPGQRLTEATLTAALGVSRGPVREAMRRLEADGLLVSEKNRGMSVRRLSRDDIVHMLEVREVLEGLAARTLSRRMATGVAREALESLHERMKACAAQGDIERYNTLYARFHTSLVASANNPLLMTLMERLNIFLLKDQLRQLIDSNLVWASAKEHEALMLALLHGDSEMAERAVRRHIAHFTEHVRALPDWMFQNGATELAREPR